MAELKLTKSELRAQQHRLTQLERYLPTLQLKKALLQQEVQEAKHELSLLDEKLQEKRSIVEEFAALLVGRIGIDLAPFVHIQEIKKRWENIAGVDIPIFVGVTFPPLTYDLFDTPAWLEGAIHGLQNMAHVEAEIIVVEEKRKALEKELREVSIRVNLFEKILIPRAHANIKKIRVFLGDQQLAAVSQAKVAKTKIELRKLHHNENPDQTELWVL